VNSLDEGSLHACTVARSEIGASAVLTRRYR
jgi:hypothetical protein